MAISGKYAPKGATQKVKVKKNAGDNPKAKGGKAKVKIKTTGGK